MSEYLISMFNIGEVIIGASTILDEYEDKGDDKSGTSEIENKEENKDSILIDIIFDLSEITNKISSTLSRFVSEDVFNNEHGYYSEPENFNLKQSNYTTCTQSVMKCLGVNKDPKFNERFREFQ